MNRSRGAAWLALALGLAAATSVEAATTATLWTAESIVGTPFSSGITLSQGDAPRFDFMNQNLKLGIGPASFYQGDEAWSVDGDWSWVPGQHFMYSSSYIYGARVGDQNYAIVRDFSEGGSKYVVQFDFTADRTAVPLAWAQSDISALTIAAGKSAIDALSAPAGGGTSAVPEASTSLGLLALGAGGLFTRRRLKRKA